MPSAWRTLNLPSQNGGVISLLTQHDFGSSNYTVWLTDLTCLWKESLDRRQIIKKAFSIDTSIDPSEDAGQMQLLLSSICKALDQEAGTNVIVSPRDHGSQLSMNLTTPLPASLPPLQWTLTLEKASQPEFTSQFVMPLLTGQITLATQTTSLVQQVKDKDTVIAKLMNQLQSDGSDLNKVFPGARFSSKANVREIAGRSVKGVAEFDEDRWRSRISQENAVPLRLMDLLSRVPFNASVEASDSIYLANNHSWWDGLGPRSPTGILQNLDGKMLAAHRDTDNWSENDDFQVNKLYLGISLLKTR